MTRLPGSTLRVIRDNDPYHSDSTLRIVIPRDKGLVLHVESLFLETNDPRLPGSTLKKIQMTPPPPLVLQLELLFLETNDPGSTLKNHYSYAQFNTTDVVSIKLAMQNVIIHC